MKKLIILTLTALALTSCTGYYDAIERRDTLQVQANFARVEGFSKAMTAAAVTESPVDDVAIAMAYGLSPRAQFQMIESPVEWFKVFVQALPFGIQGYSIYERSQRDETATYQVGGDFTLNGQNRTIGDGNSNNQSWTFNPMIAEEGESEEVE